MPDPFKKNQETCRLLFNLFHDHVYRTAYYITKNHELAEEILQETFLKVFQKLDHVEDERKVRAWLTVVASNTAIDLIRKRKRGNETPAENVVLENKHFLKEMPSSLEQQVEKRETREEVRHEITRLDAEDRQIIVLKYIEELKDKEIAELLEMKLGTVKSRLYRAKKKLKSLLTESGKFKDGGVS